MAIQPRLEIPVLSPQGKRALLRRSGLPAPLHLAGALRATPISIGSGCGRTRRLRSRD